MEYPFAAQYIRRHEYDSQGILANRNHAGKGRRYSPAAQTAEQKSWEFPQTLPNLANSSNVGTAIGSSIRMGTLTADRKPLKKDDQEKTIASNKPELEAVK